MSKNEDRRSEFESTGRVWLRSAISESNVKGLLRNLPEASGPGQRIPATSSPLYNALAQLPALAELRASWPGMKPVRIVYFDKAGQNNWSLPWHQDRVIAVRDKVEMSGYENWTRKQGDWHCEPPLEILEKMLFVRLHLDPSTLQNGAMEIARCSHRWGKLSEEEIAARVAESGTELTLAEAGDILVLPMLCLHRSRAAQGIGRRRVLRIDLASCDLPPPLDWIT